ncbi:MAG: outer membrane beta-barrel protein [Cyclobacteriaceae bacterium]
MKTLFCAFLIFGMSVTFGQSKTYVGLKGGAQVNSAFLRHTIFNFNARTTFNPGVHSGLQIKHFSKKKEVFLNSGIQGGINYIQRGWTQTFKNEGLPNYSVTMNYLEIPIEGFGYFGNKNKYFISGGMFVEFLLDSEKDPDPVGITVTDFATYVPGRDRTVGYGGRLSGGVFRDFPFGSLHLEGFITYSFSNFINAGDLTNDQLPDISNLWSVGVSVGYFISFGKLEL